jgi:hypothetical protein
MDIFKRHAAAASTIRLIGSADIAAALTGPGVMPAGLAPD